MRFAGKRFRRGQHLIPNGEIATEIPAHLKLLLAANDEIDRPFFDEDAAA